jgi:hypothetical protein
MKYLEKIFDLKPIPAFFAWGVISFLMVFGMGSLIFEFPEADLKLKVISSVGALGGLFGGLMGSLTTENMRRSQAFWDRAKEVQKRLEEAKTRKDLDTIFLEEFSNNGKLRKLYMPGAPHHHEMIRLHTILDTKYKYLPEK